MRARDEGRPPKRASAGRRRGARTRMVHTRMRLNDVPNDELLAGLNTLVGEGNRVVAKTIAYLAEVEERRLHLNLACSSMFDFCTRKLRLSEGEAFRRLTAARLVRCF